MISRAIAALALLVAGCSSADAEAPAPPDRIWGVTIDDVSDPQAIAASLAALPVKPTARVVFDEHVEPPAYAHPVAAFHEVAFVMGELLDSFYVHEDDPSAYVARAERYVEALGDDVDTWEIGNEINGEWLCAKGADHCTASETEAVVAKMASAFDLVKSRGKRAELTLYFNAGCFSDPANEMFTWVDANVPPRMLRGLDQVLVSYYEDDCGGRRPDWDRVFDALGARFPTAAIGFGECGTKHADRKAAYVDRYYRMRVDHPRYVGGYFWWYFREDMVPKSAPLFDVLHDAIAETN